MLRLTIILTAALLLCPLAIRAAQTKEGIITLEYAEADEVVAMRSMAVLQDALEEFTPLLPTDNEPIFVRLAHTVDEFASEAPEMADLPISGMARSSEGTIVLKAPRLRRLGDDYAGTLRHELVHVLLHRNTNPAYLPHWLNEGIAMSLANEAHWGAPLRVARMKLERQLIAYRDLNAAFTAPGTHTEFTDAYAQALSMTRFLRDRLGEATFWQIIRATAHMPFPDALRQYAGWSIPDLWNKYEQSLWGLGVLSMIATGSLLTPAALLFVLVYLKKRHMSRKLYRRWEEEELDMDEDGPVSWDDVASDPEDWKRGAQE